MLRVPQDNSRIEIHLVSGAGESQDEPTSPPEAPSLSDSQAWTTALDSLSLFCRIRLGSAIPWLARGYLVRPTRLRDVYAPRASGQL